MAQIPNNFDLKQLKRTTVAIDFGTSRTAVAFAPNNNADKRIYSYQEWDDTFQGDKTNTAILLSAADNHCIEFGNAAKKQYMTGVQKLVSESEDSKERETNVKSNDLFFDKFKMALYDCNERGQKIAIKSKLRAANGVECKAETVFVAALMRIKEYSLKWLRNHLTVDPTIDDIDWIVTVPAIWSDLSKDLMLQWSIKAGITFDVNHRNYRSDHFKVVYEPDCAALYVISEMRSANKPFQTGDAYILCDLGGGTADIAVHQIMGDTTVGELSMPSGGDWGSTVIDAHFRKQLSEVFPSNWIASFMVSHPSVFVELMENFVKAKESFNPSVGTGQTAKRRQNYHRVMVPPAFLDEMDDRLEKSVFNHSDIEAMVETFRFKREKRVWILDDDYFKISVNIWKSFFDKILTPIVNHIQSKIAEHPNVKYIALVGGLNESKYVRSRLITEFGPDSRYGLSIITPNKPMLAVVKGAALMGFHSTFISQRIAAKTYGFIFTKPVSEFRSQNIDIPQSVLKRKQFSELSQNWWIPHFHILIAKGNTVPSNKIIRHSAQFSGQNCAVLLQIYGSDIESPVWDSDGSKLGEITVAYPLKWNLADLFTICFEFGDTTIKSWVEFGNGTEQITKPLIVRYDYDN